MRLTLHVGLSQLQRKRARNFGLAELVVTTGALISKMFEITWCETRLRYSYWKRENFSAAVGGIGERIAYRRNYSK